MRRLGWIALLVSGGLTTSCDAIVGGECSPGFAPVAGACAPLTGELVADGGAGVGGGDLGGYGGTGGSGQGGMGLGGAGAGGNGAGGSVICDDGLTACAEGCVDLQSSVSNCGSCGFFCPTEVCVAGTCAGAPVGHMVVLGMNYVESTASTRRVLGNAAFLPIHNPLRVLEYRTYANLGSVQSVINVIGEQGSIRGRSIAVTTAQDATAVATMDGNKHDVLLIHDQVSAPRDWGTSFANETSLALEAFTRGGGTVIILATEGALEMPPLVRALGSMQLRTLAHLDGPNVVNHAPTDVIGIGVQSPALAKNVTSVLLLDDAPDPTLSFVLTEENDASRPIVVHKAIVPD